LGIWNTIHYQGLCTTYIYYQLLYEFYRRAGCV